MLTFKEIIKQDKERANARVYCKYCGHSIVMTNQHQKRICNNCGRIIFGNPTEEFKYKTIEARTKEKRKNNERKIHENL